MTQSIKARLKAGESVLGTFSSLSDPAVVEIFAGAGFDFLLIDAEHGPGHWRELESMIRAADVHNKSVIVRIPDFQRVTILKPLDLGAVGVMVAMVNQASDAAQVAAFAHYPPFGKRGLAGSHRAVTYGLRPPREYVEEARENTLAIVQVETEESVENAEAIAQVEGIDVLFVGPADLAMSMGVSGREDPKIQSAMKHVADVAARHGKISGTLVNSKETAREALDWGMRFLVWGTVPNLLVKTARSIISEWQEVKS